MKALLSVDSALGFQASLLHELCSQHAVSPSDVTVVMTSQAALKAQTAGTFDVVVSASAAGQAHDAAVTAQLLVLTKPGGTVVLQEPVSSGSSSSAAGVSSLEKLQQQALLCGLTQGAPTAALTLPLPPALAGLEGIQLAAVKGRKPEWEVGAQQAIKRKKAAAVPQAPAVSIWSSINVDDADLLDDDELLTEEDLVRPVPPVVDDSCGPSRKACKNCTCGRAEEEAAGMPPPKLTQDMLENPGSAGGCGSCAMGDAFRCASCPYRGLPTFTPGKKIELPTGFLAADL
jgi:hypothetical protein